MAQSITNSVVEMAIYIKIQLTPIVSKSKGTDDFTTKYQSILVIHAKLRRNLRTTNGLNVF